MSGHLTSCRSDASAIRDTLMLYSNFAAILAGFAFTAVIVVLSLPREHRNDGGESDGALTVGVFSFFSLSITAVSYGSIMATSGDVFKGLLGGLLSGTALAYSALLLTLFIVLLLETLFSTSAAARYTRRMLSQFFPLLAFTGIQGPLEAYLHVQYEGSTPLPVRFTVSSYLTVLAIWGVAGFFAHRWRATTDRLSIPRSKVRWMAFITFCFCAAATAASAMYTNYARPGSSLPAGIVMAVTTLAFLGFLAFGICTFLLRPPAT
ncbi:hypothetical protein ACSNOK_07870 [Streptomyces sp. URMC 126]|uniref:hypothetical protein n=1 Tax=Streptomyces sp. URMC 126 TaxID=3423401 RepID=UPI003F1A9059